MKYSPKNYSKTYTKYTQVYKHILYTFIHVYWLKIVLKKPYEELNV